MTVLASDIAPFAGIRIPKLSVRMVTRYSMRLD